MNDEIRWLARLGIDQGLFSRNHCLKVHAKLGPAGDLMAFAQEFIDSGIVTDVERLETIAGLALRKAPQGAPADDPFATAAGAAPSAPSAPAAASGPAFAFESIGSLDDPALAAAMGALLRSTAASGASDLHLSTGARPFVRKNRVLS
ncbi:MAG: hypothetical protein JNL92_20000, partial [Opitutaceae bacterium]|nr:hypothetical protein [Opitutaceae bacterium]